MSKYSSGFAMVLVSAALVAGSSNAGAQTDGADVRPAPPLRLMPRTLSQALFPGFDRPVAHPVTRGHRYDFAKRDVPASNRFRLEPIGNDARAGLGIERERAVNNVLQLRF